jgi:3-oxoadipate enol-lactonase
LESSSYLQAVTGANLAVSRRGEGIPLVWGHSLVGNRRVDDRSGLFDWDRIGEHATVVRYDARGHGKSEGSDDPRYYRWQQLARDMLDVAGSAASAVGVDRCILGGISMGAATALEAAVQNPDRVAGLILTLPPTAWDTRPRQAGIYRRMSWISGLLGATPYRLLGRLPAPVSDDGRSRLALYTIKSLGRANPRYVQATLRGAAQSDLPDTAALQELQVPTLILAWEDDTAHPVSTAEALAESLPQVHALHVASPHESPGWTEAICDFVDAVRRRGNRGKRPGGKRPGGKRSGGKRPGGKRPRRRQVAAA